MDGARYPLKVGEYSDWVPVKFHAALGVSIRGICRFLLTEVQPEVSLYVTPINIDPEQPALPISYPPLYSTYLAKLLGPYGTLGLAEDTWALNDRVIDEDAFLKQSYDLYTEREGMFFSALERMDWGVLACVFYTSDRVRMFYRVLESEGSAPDAKYARVIEDLYCRMDQLLGKTLAFVDARTALFVLSDHGFASFKRGVNLNTWLRQNGYLAIQEGVAPSAIGLQDIDWSRTRAYAFGLAGIYFNVKGRESRGIVAPGEEAEQLKKDISRGLPGCITIPAKARRQSIRFLLAAMSTAARTWKPHPICSSAITTATESPGPRLWAKQGRKSSRTMRRRGAETIASIRAWYLAFCFRTAWPRTIQGWKTWRLLVCRFSVSRLLSTWKAGPSSSVWLKRYEPRSDFQRPDCCDCRITHGVRAGSRRGICKKSDRPRRGWNGSRFSRSALGCAPQS